MSYRIDPPDMTANEFMLTWQKVAAQQVMSGEMLSGLHNVQVVTDRILDDLLISLKANVLTDQLPPEHINSATQVSFQVPASWWQHWKEQHRDSKDPGTRWLIRRWPIRYRYEMKTAQLSIDLSRWRSYPESRYQIPDDFGRPVFGYTLSPSWRITEDDT